MSVLLFLFFFFKAGKLKKNFARGQQWEEVIEI